MQKNILLGVLFLTSFEIFPSTPAELTADDNIFNSLAPIPSELTQPNNSSYENRPFFNSNVLNFLRGDTPPTTPQNKAAMFPSSSPTNPLNTSFRILNSANPLQPNRTEGLRPLEMVALYGTYPNSSQERSSSLRLSSAPASSSCSQPEASISDPSQESSFYSYSEHNGNSSHSPELFMMNPYEQATYPRTISPSRADTPIIMDAPRLANRWSEYNSITQRLIFECERNKIKLISEEYPELLAPTPGKRQKNYTAAISLAEDITGQKWQDLTPDELKKMSEDITREEAMINMRYDRERCKILQYMIASKLKSVKS